MLNSGSLNSWFKSLSSEKCILESSLNGGKHIKPITSNYISNWKVIDVGDESNNDNNKIINHGTVETDMYGKKVMLNIFDDDGNYKKQRVFDWNGEVIWKERERERERD